MQAVDKADHGNQFKTNGKDELSLNDHEEELARTTALAVVAASERQSRTALTEVPLHLYHFSSEYTLSDPFDGRHQNSFRASNMHPRNMRPSAFLSTKSSEIFHQPVDDLVKLNRRQQEQLNANYEMTSIKKSQSFRGTGKSENFPKLRGITRHASEHIKYSPKGLFTTVQNKPSGGIFLDSSKNRWLRVNQSSMIESGNDTKQRAKPRTISQAEIDFSKEPAFERLAVTNGFVEEEHDGKVYQSPTLKEQFFSFFQPTDNKLAMKLFGTKNALNREKLRQEQHGKWIIHPCSNFRLISVHYFQNTSELDCEKTSNALSAVLIDAIHSSRLRPHNEENPGRHISGWSYSRKLEKRKKHPPYRCKPNGTPYDLYD
ncbi:potassium/sodium hyperpolarization-activated cyclic nucleotide-gated channel 4 [Clonorchis sinensis]|uniref:Potassium/sodium hyperpolarization-activated cyclic nucleotide-gated channel 4 n=1 Tax=Clonorchis sinensis TaxID=79923 RepID=H2KQG4_CLOSI|nr:potassium/sodium hyperpolarization-activated cyclic nucleotide-gated channel 4 [Clonorchis sinensis]